jgi:RecA-family ATPase
VAAKHSGLIVAEASVELICAEDIEVEKMVWLWYARLFRRSISLLEGPPEKGKSTILASLAACESNGHSFPGETQGHEPGCVVMLVAEDDIKTIVKPRLIAAGANFKRVHVLKATRDDAGDLVPFHLSDDCDRLAVECRKVGATLVIIDPLVSYLGSRSKKAVETSNDMQVRKALLPLNDLAQDLGAAVVAVRHYRKGRGTDAIEAGGGSIAFSALARVLLSALPDDEDPNRYLFSVAKGNYVPKEKRPAIRYTIVPSEHDPAIGRIQWGEAVQRTTEEIMAALAEKAKTEHSVKDRAGEWLAKRLAAGPVPRSTVIKEGIEAGFSESTIKRAETRLGVISAKSGYPATSTWTLPEGDM